MSHNQTVDMAFHEILQGREVPPLALEIDKLRAEISVIVHFYDLAKEDERSVIPTTLQIAIEAARESARR